MLADGPKNCSILMNKTYWDCQFPFENDITLYVFHPGHMFFLHVSAYNLDECFFVFKICLSMSIIH